MEIKEFEKRATYQGGYDRQFDEWKIIDVHQIPNPVPDAIEIDFYCCNGKKVYLLRIRNKEVEKYDVVYSGKGYPPYLIAELPLQDIDDQLLKYIFAKFEL
ncbi:hypothetical protein [Bacteroides sp. 519]|uniref:hypothetical protein n=1 Tax=Bacteroides sp. 519 TaxID=2302937 RepID=UPI0013D172E4|nr:hypothetical protein [Bacteroides sp. 519]NDV58126.1 hypothetical protein [Bacteroides sp. 519]